MKNFVMHMCHIVLIGSLLAAPAGAQSDEVVIDKETVAPGGMVMVKDAKVQLYGSPIGMGDNFLKVVEATDIEFPFKDKVTLVSIVPSLDTPVCEMQTYTLSQMDLPENVDVMTISRDLPMAQQRFAREHDMSAAGFVSDYKTGAFGKSTGLMMKDRELLARGVMVIDAEGIIRYLQVVPQVTHMPDLEAAAKVAVELSQK